MARDGCVHPYASSSQYANDVTVRDRRDSQMLCCEGYDFLFFLSFSQRAFFLVRRPFQAAVLLLCKIFHGVAFFFKVMFFLFTQAVVLGGEVRDCFFIPAKNRNTFNRIPAHD